MRNNKAASIPASRLAFTRRHKLRAAVRRALAQQRPALSVGAGLVALGLATQPVLAAPFPALLELSSLNGRNGFVLNGIDAGDYSGESVSGAGDVNGDGVEDFIIGAPVAARDGRSAVGESYIVFGRAGLGEDGSLELSTLDGADGFVLNGIDAYDRSGNSVSGAGDVNDDGLADLIIGTDGADPNGLSYAGESYVVFGGAGLGAAGSFDLGALDGSNGFVLNGIDPDDRSGRTLAGAGDVNGDGVADLIIGATGAEPNGESYVVFGSENLGASGSLELAALDGSNGFVLKNSDDGVVALGWSVSGAGDVNGDGFEDLIIGVYGAEPDGQDYAGESYVVFGGAALGAGGSLDLSALDGNNGFVLIGAEAEDYSGRSVSGAGDINGDGVADLIIGADGGERNDLPYAGESYVVFGAAGLGTGGSLELATLDGSNGFVVHGVDVDDRAGAAVNAAGDINGDGMADLIIGAYTYGSYVGQSYVVFGSAGLGAAGGLDLGALDGGNGFAMNGIDAGDYSGKSVSGAGDVNGDGIDDLLIGAPGSRDDAGDSYVVFGRSANDDIVKCAGLEATIVGTPGDDIIRGTSRSDVIHGLGGNDTIRGLRGNDIVCGGQGNDVIHGNAGNDRLFAGPGEDRLSGGPNNDHLDGGAGPDDCDGGKGIGDTATSCEQSTNTP